MSQFREPSGRWADYRDIFAATREAMIVAAIVLVFVAPSFVRTSLERAGISSFAGLEFGIEEVVDANEEVVAAEEEVSRLAEQLANVEQRLESLSATGRSVKPSDIKAIASTVHDLSSQAHDVNEHLTQSAQRIDKAIHMVPPERLRELAERNSKRNELRDERYQQQSSDPPMPRAAFLEDLLIQPGEMPEQTITR